MLIPLHDANALRHIKKPYVTRSLIVINFIVYLLMLPEGFAAAADSAVMVLGFIPALVTHQAVLPEALQGLPPGFTYVTYSFLHGSFMHVGLNMLFLWIFGDNVEDALGHVKFLVFYFACAAAGAFAHQLLAFDPEAPLIGASGAISGIIMAYAMLHPHVRLWVLVFFGIPLPLPAFIPLLFWVGQQFFQLMTGYGEGVSFAAHVGGIVAGGVLVVVLRRKGVPLFDRNLAPVREVSSAEKEPMAQTDENDEGPGDPPPSASRPPVRWGR